DLGPEAVDSGEARLGRAAGNRTARHQPGIERLDLMIRGVREMIVGEGGVELRAVASDTAPHRPLERFIGPGADAVVGMRRDVGREHLAEWRLERSAAGQRPGRRIGVAAGAIAELREVLALGDKIAVERAGGWRRDLVDLQMPRERDPSHHSRGAHERNPNHERTASGQIRLLRLRTITPVASFGFGPFWSRAVETAGL